MNGQPLGQSLLRHFFRLLLPIIAVPCVHPSIRADEAQFRVGAARVDVTPDHPVRLNGYLARRNLPEATEADTPLFVRALAITDHAGTTVVLVTIDTCAIPRWFRLRLEELASDRFGLPAPRLAITCTHTHYAPILYDAIPFIFGMDIPSEDLAHIRRYTERVLAACVTAIDQALKNRTPARLAWQVGKVTFAANRRTKGGPVDHSLPVLWARSIATNKPLAVLTTYACHATTIPPSDNKFHGDWPGVAALTIEERFPGSVALVSIGCGADANPQPRGSAELARKYGIEIADEVSRLSEADARPVRGPLRTRFEWIDLPFAEVPTRAEWERRAQSKHEPTAYHARHFLRLLETGHEIPRSVRYPVQTWCFDKDLAMVFLGGEVVVDYALRLRREFRADKLWVHGYANTVPCYIASKRVLREGGYEADSSMIYYGQPTRLSPRAEDLIIDTVQRLLPHDFYAPEKQLEYPPPREPEETRSSIVVPDGYRVELAAAEPLVVDPVAIDFGADGQLWVVEYRDYPMGLPDNYRPGGRIKWLRDRDRDGRFDEAHVYADRIPFPTGIMEWGDGVLVGAAPDILWLRDTDGDGVADKRIVLATGFYTDNYQARVNGFRIGLDGWIYGSCGLFGGDIRLLGNERPVHLRQRDFCLSMRPLALRAAGGRSQYGRVRDDWGHWFGNTNSQVLLFYPLPGHYLERTATKFSPPLSVYVPDSSYESTRLFPRSRTLTRFNNPEHYNRVTSACGPEIYRDVILGRELYGNAFVCDPVHNVVTRLVLRREGLLYRGRRAPGEEAREFLASSDNWFRPVQVRTGPDGALWVVDMYRFVIEHPRWISPERLRKLDVRAGEEMGRIYRVVPADRRTRPIRDLAALSEKELIDQLDTDNGCVRDLVHRLLCERGVSEQGARRLIQLATAARSAAVRLQALCILGSVGALKDGLIARAAADPSPSVRRWAIRWAESRLEQSESLFAVVAEHVADEDPEVRLQVAFTLGQTERPLAGRLLAQLARHDGSDPYVAAAVLSSSGPHWKVMAEEFARGPAAPDPFWSAFWEQVAEYYSPQEAVDYFSVLVDRITSSADSSFACHEAVIRLLTGTRRKRRRGEQPERRLETALLQLVRRADALLSHGELSDAELALAISTLREAVALGIANVQVLAKRIGSHAPPRMQQLALDAIFEAAPAAAPGVVLRRWSELSPSIQQRSLELLLSSSSGARTILEALQSGTLAVLDLTPSQRQRLLQHPDQHIAQAARSLLQVPTSEREELVEQKLAALAKLKGDPARGRSLFEKHCAACHEPHRGRGRLGPDLAELTDRSTTALVRSILDPNASVDDRYLSYVFVTTQGQLITGLVAEETAGTIVLGLPDGTRTTLARTQVEAVRNTGRSLMPEGFEQELTDQELADLVAYIQQVAPAAKVVRPRADGSFILPVTAALIEGNAAKVTQFRNVTTLGAWQPEAGRVRWQLVLKQGGDFLLLADWLNESPTPGRFRILVHPPSNGRSLVWPAEPTEVPGEGNWFRTEPIGSVRLDAGTATIELIPTSPAAFPEVHIRSLMLRPQPEQTVSAD